MAKDGGAVRIARCVRDLNGERREIVRIDVAGQVIEAVRLDMAEQWDFMEIAGHQIDNEVWVNTALLASSVISIDGVPEPMSGRTREQLRRVLKKIGEAGIDALSIAFDDPEPAGSAAELAAAAGN